MRLTILLLFIFIVNINFAQTCNCLSNFEWVKKTFEENDAGYQYSIQNKGIDAYVEHNKAILELIKNTNTISECTPILYQWLNFFRKSHIGIQLNENLQQINKNQSEDNFKDWETIKINNQEFKEYLNKTSTDYFEGIWETTPYKIGIKKNGDEYVGFILESGVNTWKEGQVKLKFSLTNNNAKSVYFMRDHSAVESSSVQLIGKNHLQIGNFTLSKTYPFYEDEPKYKRYFKLINTKEPYIEQLNDKTLYLRIPSFNDFYKSKIDSLMITNKNIITSLPNLIIDIRNNGGGSDASYSEVIPYLYTNPIREIEVEYLSTKLNNQRMLDFINKPEYGFNEEGKKWAKESFDILEKKLGEFVNLSKEAVTIGRLDTVYPYPANVGIIINEVNASSAEQFLLEAKQSRKVKLFGVTTFGILDISNMYFIESPCKEFKLGYCLSKSLRIPDYTIDNKGIQPDYYLDKTIPNYDWVEFVNNTLNNK